MKISPQLKGLLKIANKANPTLQAMLINLMAYKPTFLVQEKPEAPPEIGMEAEAQAPDAVEAMKTAEDALKRLIHLPPKAWFLPGPHIHVQFDGGAQDGHGTGGFVILDQDQREVVRAGRYYGPSRTNNEAEAFAMRDAMHCLARITDQFSQLSPVRVFGDS